ncbi:MAG: antibiotic biosynthesis monooxygenase [Actinomycetes bacterium]
MLVVTRLRVADGDQRPFLEEARAALAALRAQPGFRRGHVGRAADDPGLWVLATEWAGVGAYRRALSAYDVKLRATPLMAHAVDEPSAFEVLETSDADSTTASSTPSRRAADAETVGPGSASGPQAPTDLG